MKLLVIKSVSIPKGLIFSIDEPMFKAFKSVCDDLGDGVLKMEHSGCSFKAGQRVAMPSASARMFGGLFNKHFENLDAPVEAIVEVIEPVEGDDLAEAMIELLKKGEVSKTTGKPSCKTLSEMLNRDISSKERDDMMSELEEVK